MLISKISTSFKFRNNFKNISKFLSKYDMYTIECLVCHHSKSSGLETYNYIIHDYDYITLFEYLCIDNFKFKAYSIPDACVLACVTQYIVDCYSYGYFTFNDYLANLLESDIKNINDLSNIELLHGLISKYYHVSSQTTNTKIHVSHFYRHRDIILDIFNSNIIDCNVILKAIKGIKRAPRYNLRKYQKAKPTSDFFGVGIVVKQVDTKFIIDTVKDLSPAYFAGLKAYDILVRVDYLELNNLNLAELVNLIRGKYYSQVVISVNRDNTIIDYNIKRTKAL
jgi:hypothetical protein